MMGLKKTNDRLIASLETTMSGLRFSKGPTGLVRIETETGELMAGAIEAPSILDMTPPSTPTREDSGRHGAANRLPMEIVCLVLEFVPKGRQDVFAATSKVSRLWYFASQKFLYRNPKITGNNYNKFVTTISPTSTHIKPSPLSALVKRLDLSALVHHGRPSHNARLLRRVHSSLEEFVAPQSSFGFSCIVALGHCRSLQVLDLSLVSQTMSLDELFRHIADLPCLRELNFPRSSLVAKTSQFTFPVNLQRFSLSGAVITLFSHDTVLPPALEELHISHCPFTKAPTIVSLLARLGDQLTTLSVSYPMPYLAFNSMDNILNLCPNLTYLLVAVDYISSHFFDEGSAHPLEHLDLDSSGSAGNELKVSPNDVFIAMAEDRLPHLRIVRVSKLLKWVEREREDVDDLVEMLETKAFEADPVRNVKVGVWEFGGERGNRFGGALVNPTTKRNWAEAGARSAVVANFLFTPTSGPSSTAGLR